MKITFEIDGRGFQADPNNYFDLSRSLMADGSNLESFGAGQPKVFPYSGEGWALSVEQGASCNCFSVNFTPHCHGTHTESIGHIKKERDSISDVLKEFLLASELVSIEPEIKENGDKVITKAQLKNARKYSGTRALILRSLPNTKDKIGQVYSGANPAYLEPEACAWLAEIGVDHLLLDLPSVDREDDGGKMLAHKAYWKYESEQRNLATITELIYVPNKAADGLYVLNLQVANFDLDAAPSRPLIFPVIEIDS